MRLRHEDGTLVHLSYNAGVHPAEDLENLIAHLTRYAVPVRKRLGVERMGVGLWLSPGVADHLTADRIELVRLRRSLEERGLEVVSLNGTGGRNWRSRPRLGEARTLPLHDGAGQDPGLPAARGRHASAASPPSPSAGAVTGPPTCTRSRPGAWRRLARELRGLYSVTGKTIRVGFEPWPGCVLETTEQALERVCGIDSEHLGVCLDACHLACGDEEPGAALRGLAAAGASGGQAGPRAQPQRGSAQHGRRCCTTPWPRCFRVR